MPVAERVAKTSANEKAGAAPTGPASNRKRAASSVKQSVKSKAQKRVLSQPEDVDMLLHSDENKAAKSSRRSVKNRVESPDPEADDDDADSEPEEHDTPDDDDACDDDDTDLAQFGDDPSALSKALALETPQWTAGTDDDNRLDDVEYERSASRASSSSGYTSVPASELPSSESESDAEKSKAQAATSDNIPEAPPIRKIKEPVIGKRQLARDAEKPTWNPVAMAAQSKPARRTLASTSLQVKVEQTVVPLGRPPTIKREIGDMSLASASTSEPIEISDDDDEPPVSNINVVLVDGKVGLKAQVPSVERTVQFAIEYHLGYHLFKYAFPPSQQKTDFSRDALCNAAHTLHYENIQKRVEEDDQYCDLLATLLQGRVSSFRLKAKTASDMAIVSHYGLLKDTENRVLFFAGGMRYIYPSSPGPMDPKTNKRGDDVVDLNRPYMADAIHQTLENAYFKGSPPIASKYASLFKTNQDGNKECPAAMVALASTAVHCSLNEYRTGRYIASKFEGKILQEVYDTHMVLLEEVKISHPTVLADIYEIVAGGSRLANIRNQPMAKEALALLRAGRSGV
ncbi:hypothetical protein C8R45DRAFT_936972 [Mycena sanguinolenta]|nr:hypothetical protein C8R45DRAFT_936961 [Mycena sanguinolenta]KAJ6471540.1 hypothetical protein C8R45DRAFT_936972 [Mycena sanguinolenta]